MTREERRRGGEQNSHDGFVGATKLRLPDDVFRLILEAWDN